MPDDRMALAAGRAVGHRRRGQAEGEVVRFARQLLAAVLCQAVEDALQGDPEAARFVEKEGHSILLALGLPAACFERWRQADVSSLRHAIGLGYEERKRLYVERRRQRTRRIRGAEVREPPAGSARRA